MISSQYGTIFRKSQYGKIQKVYSIWVVMNPPKYRRNTIAQYSVVEKNQIGRMKEKHANYDRMAIVMICLGGPEGENYNGIIKLLDVLLSKQYKPVEKRKILQEEFDIPMTEKMERSVKSMCNLSEGVWREGVREGRKQGRREGKREGRKVEGVRIVTSMHKKGYTLEQIADVTEKSIEEIQTIIKKRQFHMCNAA